jgi:hypothetical protein
MPAEAVLAARAARIAEFFIMAMMMMMLVDGKMNDG